MPMLCLRTWARNVQTGMWFFRYVYSVWCNTDFSILGFSTPFIQLLKFSWRMWVPLILSLLMGIYHVQPMTCRFYYSHIQPECLWLGNGFAGKRIASTEPLSERRFQRQVNRCKISMINMVVASVCTHTNATFICPHASVLKILSL